MANVITINRPDVVALVERAAAKLTRGNKTEAVALALRGLLDADARERSLFGAHAGSSGMGVWDVSKWDNFLWGATLSLTNLRFPGQYTDAETALNQNWFRDYDPTIGRYIQSDPIGPRGGINTYGYVGGNPLRRQDRMGLDPHKYVITVSTLCSPCNAFNALKAPGMSAPFAPQAQEGFNGEVDLLFSNPISQDVDSANMTIVNTTLPNHRYYPGQVVMQVTPGPGEGSTINITGTGTGKHTEENNVVGGTFFGGVANLIALGCALAPGAPFMSP